MLTGVHPFDLYGNATDDEIEHQILAGKRPPLGNSPLTAHLSPEAVSVIDQLVQWDPQKRLTADQLLEHPWVRGDTARTSIMADSDKRLSAYRAFRTKLGAKVFADMISWTADGTSKPTHDADNVALRTSLLERSFKNLDSQHRGYVTTKDIQTLTKSTDSDEATVEDDIQLSLSGFSDLLSENMINRYFPKGHIIYHEGDIGNVMYFLNSGSIEVYTKDGSSPKDIRKSGDFFGEGALLHPKKIRSATIRCITPVHAIEVSREYFEKYMASEESAKLNLREKDKARKRQRAKTLLRLQQSMEEHTVPKGTYLFKAGDEGKEMYIIENGEIELSSQQRPILRLRAGEMCGEHSLIFGRPRNVDAQCVTDQCKLQRLRARDFYLLLDMHPAVKDSIREICNRRDFQKALCAKTKRPFPENEKDLLEAFQAVDVKGSGSLELHDIQDIIQQFDPSYSENDVREILKSLDLDETGQVSWPEFKRIFGMHDLPPDFG
jgi:CRP-like cAMP-binding protein